MDAIKREALDKLIELGEDAARILPKIEELIQLIHRGTRPGETLPLLYINALLDAQLALTTLQFAGGYMAILRKGSDTHVDDVSTSTPVLPIEGDI